MNLLEREDALLLPCALHYTEHGGRDYPEEETSRTPFARDRDRIIHSRAFRRLGYKTQVFVNSQGDNYRTRLTHSMEVSQVARSVARALGLNQDYAECLALAHDLGHPPFGHAGQDVLHMLMQEHGGFEHNCQSLRIVSRLEERYMHFEGLNLCRATLKGMLKHPRVYDCDTQLHDILAERKSGAPALEARLVDLCDQLTYTYHDLDDGLDAGILDFDEVRELPAWEVEEKLARRDAAFARSRRPVQIRVILRQLLGRWIGDLTETTGEWIRTVGPGSVQDVYALPPERYPVRLSPTTEESVQEIRKFLFSKLYRHSSVLKMSRRGENILRELFSEYLARPGMLSERSAMQLNSHGLERVVCDYIAGMTDRFALKEYAYLSGMDQAVL
ncbi:MAG: deoxyguanosinetriphosphate triphosphohydrolase [Spirochaetales bacterium]|nr:deoxyguanosinetriphosphate triphosphohydrolase [Spirochaetales bacterium]